MTDRKELELLIRATLKGRGEIESIAKTIKDLEGAIERQADAAKKGENAYDGLKASLDALRIAQEQLNARASAFKAFEKLAADIEKTSKAVDTARGKYQTYQRTLQELESSGKAATDAQIQQQNKLQDAIDRQVAKLQRQQKSYELLGAGLREIGVDTTNLAAEQQKLVQAQLAGATAIDKGQKELASYADTVAKARAATKALADEQARAKAEADLFAAAEKKAAAAAEARARAYAEFNDKQINRRGQAVSDQRQADEERKSLERQRELAALRKDIEERSAIAVRDTGLLKAADDAQSAAKGYTTLARASKDLRPRIVSLREAIDSINDPARATVANIGSLEQSVAALSSKVGALKGPVQDYAGTLRELTTAQRGLAAQSDLVDRYNRELAALRAARAEMQAARTQVAQYAAAARQGGDAGQAFVKPLAEAEVRLKRAAVAMREQVVATRDSRDVLRNAGINTAQLSAEQQRLVGIAQQAANAVRSLTDAYQQNGNAAEKPAKGLSLFRDEGRTTLSLMQRIRGELLAMAAAYVGLQGVIGLAGGAIDSFNKREGVKNQLALTVGNDRKAIDDEYAYVKAQAERIGVEFETAARGYAKFAASATLAGRSRQEIRYIFEAFTEVGRAANLSAADMDGVFKAIEQIVSKGKIQAEELRGQLGDRLFGAFQIAAKALKNQFPDLDKALEKGQVTSEQLLAIAEEYRKTVSVSLAGAMNSLSANQARLNNAVADFKLAVADGGFADAYLEVLKQLTEFLRSEDGAKFAQSISDAFSAVLKVLSLLLNNLTEVKAVAGALVGIFAVNLFANVISSAMAATAAVKGLALALTGVQKAMLVLSAFVIGWNIGAYIREKFVEVELFGIAMVRGLLEGFTLIKAGALEVFYELPRYALNAFKGMINLFNNVFAKPFVALLRDTARAVGLEGVAEALDKALGALTLKIDTQVSSNTAALREQAAKDLAAIRSITDDMADEAINRRQPKTAAKSTSGTATAKPSTGKVKPAGPTEAEIKKRENAIEAITKQLETLEAKIDRTQTDTLSKQLEAIDTEYLALKRRIEKLGGKEAAGLLKRLDEGTSQLKVQVTRKFNDKLEDENNAMLAKVEAAEAASGRKQKLDIDARLEAIRKSYEATYRQIAEQRQKLLDNGRDTAPADEAKRRLDAAVQELQTAERMKILGEELDLQQRQVTDTIKARDDYIKSIREKEEAGTISRFEAEKLIGERVEKTQPLVEQLVASGLLFAEALGAALDPAKVEAFRAALEKAKTSGGAVKAEMNSIGNVVQKSVNASIDAVIDNLQGVIEGTKSWGDVWRAVGRSILNILADILKDIIKAILKQQVLNALKYFGVGVAHEGAVIGQGFDRTRNVSPSWFAGAPRYHTGGVVGLAPDEYPAILQKNEEVLAASDPRNVMNMSKSATGQGQAPQSMRFVLVDDRAKVPEAMNSAEGEAVTMMHIRRNIATIRNEIKGG